MKRKLTKDEKQKTEKAVKSITKEVKLLKENLAYNKAIIDKQNYMRDFEDKWRPYLRDKKDEEDRDTMKELNSVFKMKEATLTELQNQLKEGVEIKKPAGVD